MFNQNMHNGYNKFRTAINNDHSFRKAHNTLRQINNFILPTLTAASVVAPEFAPIFVGSGAVLKATEQIASNFKDTKI